MDPSEGAAAVIQESVIDHPWHVVRPQGAMMSRSNSNTFTDETKPVHAARSIRTDSAGLRRLDSGASSDASSSSSSPRTPQGASDSAPFSSESDSATRSTKPSRLGQVAAAAAAASPSGPATPDVPPPAPRKPTVSPRSLPPKQPIRQRPGSGSTTPTVGSTPTTSTKANFDLLKAVKAAGPGSPLAEISTEIPKETVRAVKEARSKAKHHLARISPPVDEGHVPKRSMNKSPRRCTMDDALTTFGSRSSATTIIEVQESINENGTLGSELPRLPLGRVASTETISSMDHKSDSPDAMSRHVRFSEGASPVNSARSSMVMRCSGIGMQLQQDDQSPLPSSKGMTEMPDAEEEAYSHSKSTGRKMPSDWDAMIKASAALVHRVNSNKSQGFGCLKTVSLDSAALADAAERSMSPLVRSKSTGTPTPRCYRSSDSAATRVISIPVIDDKSPRRLSDKETQLMSPKEHEEELSSKSFISDARTRALQRCASAKAAITRSRAKASPLSWLMEEDTPESSTPDKPGTGDADRSQSTPSPPEEPLTPETSTENAWAVDRAPESTSANESPAAGLLQLTTAQKIKMIHLKAMWLDMEAACQASQTPAEQEELEQEMVQIQNKMLQICPSFQGK